MEKNLCIDGWCDKDEQRLTLWLLALENQSELIVFTVTTFDFQLHLINFVEKVPGLKIKTNSNDY